MPKASKGLTPMVEQYRRIKSEQKGSILFFQLGEFYEMFGEDAKEVSSLLNITLANRNGVPMCGFPIHAARVYIARLLKLGKKIAICEQVSSQPAKGQKITDREVVEVITPGTTVDEDFLDKDSFNYLAALARAPGGALSFAYIDLSTGDFYASFFDANDSSGQLRAELERLSIREMLVQESLLEEDSGVATAIGERGGLVLNRWADWLFEAGGAARRLERQFSVANLKSFGLNEKSPQIIAAGALLDYLDSTAQSLIPHVRTIKIYEESDYVGIDESSQRNLELLRNLRDGDARYSLLEVMNETRCAMGLRLLKRRILHPLRNRARIQGRLDMVEKLYRDQGLLSKLRDLLGKTPDIERLSSKLAMDKASGRDMLAIKNALGRFKGIMELAAGINPVFEAADGLPAPGSLAEGLLAGGFDANAVARLDLLFGLLEKGICEEPSALLNEGNLIKSGYNAELDKLHLLRDSGRKFLEAYLEEERLNTGIPALKMNHNRLIGYFFEATKAQSARIPSHFIRRQGTVNTERFSTDRLAELESEINGASENVVNFEKKLFLEIREKAKEVLPELFLAGRCLAELDAAQSLARAASVRGWVKPALSEAAVLEVYEGRHPVVEAHIGRGDYIPNDIVISSRQEDASPSFVLLTGPNMAGKSTYLRSAALITLMAQVGSFVPAREARVGLCDRIYCRVGASDNLARGESTFLVEMSETAFILNTASEKSLVIMDEVGRGTGTNDGLSIAWAVSEELINRVGCRTFFATHYHELSRLSQPGMVNRSMEVLDNEGEIVFLRKLKEGPAAESYGIHVAQLAGLSENVLERAKEIMESLGAQGFGSAAPPPAKAPASYDPGLLSVKKALQNLDPYGISPMDALKLIIQWQEKLAKSAPALAPGGKTRAAGGKPKEEDLPEEPPEPSLFDF
ncbi:MAG: DNA mismatch repair protein MutS [Spirochaetes bacterium]|nr:DNA mismatch repair protein MutS [Spirochaetota bacterium]